MSKHATVYSATEANRQFSRLLKRVENGETILITSRNRVVAEMRPGADDIRREAEVQAERNKALNALLERARRQPYLHLGTFNRHELYD